MADTYAAIICPKCRKSLKIANRIDSEASIYTCSCTLYPAVSGILYMKRDLVREKLINAIIRRRPWFYLFSFSPLASIFFKLFNPGRLIKALGYARFISLLIILGYSKKYSRYILSREKLPSFFMGLFGLGIIKKKFGKLVDLGCGTGQFFPYYYRHMKPENVIAIDRDFISLYLARHNYRSGTKLICADLDDNLPFKKRSIDYFFMIDALYSLKSINTLFAELKRTSRKDVSGAVIQMLNVNMDHGGEQKRFPRKPSEVSHILTRAGIGNFHIISNASLWKKLNSLESIPLKKERGIEKAPVYNILFTNRKSLKMRSQYLRMMKKNKISYYQDKYLDEKK